MEEQGVPKKEYTLIVVDDEEEVREGMKDFIPWGSMGFRFVGAAENGWEALQLMETICPDAVLCDINMPVMDGLELAETVRNRYPNVKIVMLTGYDEFEYAKQAVKLNVVDFLLKPITPRELEEVFLSLKEKLMREEEEQRDLARIRQKLQESYPILRERYLLQWVMGRIRYEEIKARLDSVGIHVDGERWAAMIIEADLTAAHPFQQDADLMTFAITNVSEEWSRMHFQGGYAFVNALNQPVLLVPCAPLDEDDAERALLDGAYSLQQVLKHTLKITVTIGVGESVHPSMIDRSYRHAMRTLDYRFLLEGTPVLYIKDLERDGRDNDRQKLEELEDKLVSQLKVASAGEIREWIDDYFRTLATSALEPELCKIYVVELTALLSRSYPVPMSSLYREGAFHPIQMISRCTSLQQMKQLIESWCFEILRNITRQRDHYYEEIVEKAVRFIRDRYADDQCSVQMMCDHLHISPSYFSMIFKKVTGETFVEYLTGVRLEKARELLRTTSLKVYEIAEKTGFNNHHYFSAVFKKHVGVTPSEFRKRIWEGIGCSNEPGNERSNTAASSGT